MAMENLEQTVSAAINQAVKLGVQGVRASAGHSRNFDISWRKGKIENMSSAGESGLSISLFVDGRYGSFHTSDLRPESVSAFIAKGISMTRLLEEDPARTLAPQSLYGDLDPSGLDLYDGNVQAMTADMMTEKCRELEDACAAHTEIPITDISVEFGTNVSESYMATNNGFSGSRRSTNAAWSAQLTLADGDKKPSDYGFSQARYLSDLTGAKDIASEAAHYAALRLGQKKLPSGNRTLVLDRRVAARLLGSYLSPLHGMSLVMKKSYFEGKIGSAVASELLDLYDDPTIVRGMGSRTFDAEGIRTVSRKIFDKGTLSTYLLDVYSANKLTMHPTGGSTSNLVLTPGIRSLDDIIADVDYGIYVTGMLGGNKDDVRGDFSHGIVGVAIEHGKLTDHVSEMNITGNHTDFWKRLVEVANDPRQDSSSRIPSLRIDDVSVSGA